jgi:hypothetical protein
MFQQAYEQMKTKASTSESIPMPAPENKSILDGLQQIKVSIINLEIIQITRNEPKIVQCLMAKIYTDTLKTPITAITAAQSFKHEEQQRVRAEEKFSQSFY